MTDDFLILGKSEVECKRARDLALNILHQLGWEVNPDKVTEPATTITFLGFYLDISKMELSIPRDRLNR